MTRNQILTMFFIFFVGSTGIRNNMLYGWMSTGLHTYQMRGKKCNSMIDSLFYWEVS
jgi:hypothetical protein